MRKLVFAIVATTAMMLAGWTEATTLAGALADSPTSNQSQIEKVDCIALSGVCPWERHRVCNGMVCSCAPCGGLWRLWHH
jgi:hypothetical protein